jgi:hypothetical protein
MGEARCGGGGKGERNEGPPIFPRSLSLAFGFLPPLASPILALSPKIALSTEVSSLPMGAFIKYLHQVLLFLMLFT